MAVVRCENGHYYDDEKYAGCPHCRAPLPQDPRRTMADRPTVFGAPLAGIAEAALAGAPQRQHMQVDLGAAPAPNSDKTVGVFRTAKGCDPVVGWLVCVAGREKGRDFRLHAGRNFIGRDMKSDIALVDDERVTREDHCSLVFEPRRGAFVLARGKGDGVTVNGERLEDNKPLTGDEVIELGSSTFVFVPFCREGRSW